MDPEPNPRVARVLKALGSLRLDDVDAAADAMFWRSPAVVARLVSLEKRRQKETEKGEG